MTTDELFYTTYNRTEKNANPRIQFQGFTLCALYARKSDTTMLNGEQVANHCEKLAIAAHAKWMAQ